jgi:hypothetical protein
MTDTSPSERIDPGAEQHQRDDLARDVAEMWGPAVSLADAATGTIRKDWPGLALALDRLAAAYREGST